MSSQGSSLAHWAVQPLKGSTGSATSPTLIRITCPWYAATNQPEF
jgi:hypothetical protein